MKITKHELQHCQRNQKGQDLRYTSKPETIFLFTNTYVNIDK